VRVTGQIDGNVRAAVNTILIPGSVGRNVMAWAQNVTVDSSGKVGRSVTSFCQTLGVEGKVGGDVVAFDQSTRIAGTVDGEVSARGEMMTIKGTARVTGPVRFEGEVEPRVEEGAKLAAGPVSFTPHKPKSGIESKGGYYIWRLLWTSSFILLGLVLTWLMPNFAGECVTAAENPAASLGLGVLVGISAPIAACLVCLTFVGIPLGITGLMLWLVLLFTAQLVVGGLIGRWILGRTEDTWGRVGRMALGMAILGVIVPILHQLEFVEALFRMAAMIWGFGAISLALYRRVLRVPGIPVPPPIAA
jgi:cytoskeletal protein CcmA (bactofilin family)